MSSSFVPNYLYTRHVKKRGLVMWLETQHKTKNWWIIIGPDSWVAKAHGAFDLKTFLKKRSAEGVNVY